MEFVFYVNTQTNCKQNGSKKAQDQNIEFAEQIFHYFEIYFDSQKLNSEKDLFQKKKTFCNVYFV